MKLNIYCILFLLFLFHTNLHAINPLKKYNYYPTDFSLQYVEDSVFSEDGCKIVIWKIKAREVKCKRNPILLAYGDAGNMGEWLGVANMLSNLGHEVCMFDYRGFGSSEDFKCDQNTLFYTEHYMDFIAVVDYMATNYEKFNILSFSMSTIFVQKYLYEHKDNSHIKSCVMDGFIRYPERIALRIQNLNGKILSYPNNMLPHWSFDTNTTKILIVQALQDLICKPEDFADLLGRPDISIFKFDCTHNQAIFQFPSEYYLQISSYL